MVGVSSVLWHKAFTAKAMLRQFVQLIKQKQLIKVTRQIHRRPNTAKRQFKPYMKIILWNKKCFIQLYKKINFVHSYIERNTSHIS